MPNTQQLPYGLRITFLLHTIIAGLIGLQHLVAPRVWTDLAGMEVTETVTWRVLGAALIGFAVSSWLAYKENVWTRVKIVVVMEFVWSALGALTIVWGIIFEGLAPLEWLNVVILGCFAITFAVYFARLRSA